MGNPEIINSYATEVTQLAVSATATETSYYSPLKSLFERILSDLNLPFLVRTGTHESRIGGGQDLPDLAFYDRGGDYVVLPCEVKVPSLELSDIIASTERNDQIGRYLQHSGVLIVSNVRSIGLVTLAPGTSRATPVPPGCRVLDQSVELWGSLATLRKGKKLAPSAQHELKELVDEAFLRFAPLATPESLAKVFARQARRAKDQLPTEFSEAIKPLAEDFKNALGITFDGDEGIEFFRSSLVQTVFYGLFAAWTLWVKGGAKQLFRWEDLGEYLQIPFLGGLFHEIRHPQRMRELGLQKFLDGATETLARVDRDEFFSHFNTPTIHPAKAISETAANAILYFYEPFLEAFDPGLRKELGVWYTPPEIVRYQVRTADLLLREDLGCARGLADESVVLLDPCCGTGTYLVEVLRVIAEQLESEGVGDNLGERLLDAAQQRVIGFEILTAPFVIAQLQMYLLFSDIGCPVLEGQRPAVFLTNSLTGWNGPEQVKLHFPELQEEHEAAWRVKREGRIIVVIGNPPYNRFAGVPLSEELDLADYYKGIKRDKDGKQIGNSKLYEDWDIRKHLLDDLYVRFFRLAERCIGERAEYGIISFISNYSFYTGRSHPIMRESLLHSFDSIWIDNLNGDKYKTGKVIPRGLPGAGTTDQSVFSTDHDSRGIQVGAGITTMVKRMGSRTGNPAVVHVRDFWGRSEAKRTAIVDSLNIKDWAGSEHEALFTTPAGPRPFISFTPTKENRWKLIPFAPQGGFEDWPAIDELFQKSIQGVNPNRGLKGTVIEIDKTTLEMRMRNYFSDMKTKKFAEEHPAMMKKWARYNDPSGVRKRLRKNASFEASRLVPYVLFPLDRRWLYWETREKLLNEARVDLWENIHSNEFLVAIPEPRKYSEIRPLLLTSAYDLHLHDRGSTGFPMAIKVSCEASLFEEARVQVRANLNLNVWNSLKNAWTIDGDIYDATAKHIARSLARVCLAVCHAPLYEREHKDSLAQDWAHIPIPRVFDEFTKVATAGDQVALLLNPLADVSTLVTDLLGPAMKELAVVHRSDGKPIRTADMEVKYSFFGGATGGWKQRPKEQMSYWNAVWGETNGDLFISERVFFKNVPQSVWSYELGGYPILKKWLGYRDKGRRPETPLSLQEVDHIRGIVRRIAALQVLHERLNSYYESISQNCFRRTELGLD